MRLRHSLLLLVFLLAACNMQQLPTPDSDGNIYVTATPILPTPDADGVVWVTATPNTLNVSNVDTAVAPATAPPTVTFTPTPIPDPA